MAVEDQVGAQWRLHHILDASERLAVSRAHSQQLAHRGDLVLVVAELTTLADLGLIDQLLAWRDRLGKLVFGRRPTLEQSTRERWVRA